MIDQSVHRAAWLYYGHGLRQDEISQIMNISRATVVNYLRRAREIGAVHISLSNALFQQDILARELEDHFQLQGVWIVPDNADSLAGSFSATCASVLLELVTSGTKIALAWGQTLYSVVDALPKSDLENVTVSQICGNLSGPFDYLPDQCTIEMARKLNARGSNLYAPLVLGSEELARALRNEPMIERQLADLVGCNLAVFSVGACEPDSHIVLCGAISAEELAECRALGAVGVIAGRLIDENGQELDCRYNCRIISAELNTLRQIPKRLVVVDSRDKSAGLLAAIRGRLVSHLVVSASVARDLGAAIAAEPNERRLKSIDRN
ncbi:MAG: sugar-binding transcriptional regulator [Alphaproteobacteria bacterium]|nr:sugar-binding transcriptional regulator [Alphaproteobacteria bacterium]